MQVVIFKVPFYLQIIKKASGRKIDNDIKWLYVGIIPLYRGSCESILHFVLHSLFILLKNSGLIQFVAKRRFPAQAVLIGKQKLKSF